MSLLDFAISLLATLAVHATLGLGAAWLLERAGVLRNPGWAELAWRAALFGALLSTTLAGLRWYDQVAPAAPSPPTAAHAVGITTGSTARVAAPPARQNTSAAPAAAGPGPSANTAPGLAIADAGRAAPAFALPDAAAGLLISLWLLALLAAALGLARQLVCLRRVARALPGLASPGPAGLVRQARELAGQARLATPALAQLPGLDSPMLMPGGTLLLPDWAAALPPAQQRALLAHELAHLERRDPAWRLLQRAALLPLAWHPLARHAVRRLEALAEDACDARAAEWTGDPRALAECLAACLSLAGPRAGQPALAVAMAGAPGPVVRRVRNLLEKTTMSIRPPNPALRRTALVLGLAALVAVPGLAIGTYASEAFAGIGEFISIDGSEHRYRSNTSEGSVDLRLRGEVAFNAAETDVESLGEGARFSLETRRDGVRRAYRVETVDGRLVRHYRVDGREAELDAAARAWLAAELPVLLRETGVNAEARGKRILAAGGTDALLAEIEAIRSEHAARVYTGVLAASVALDDGQLDRLLRRVDRFESDYERRQAYAAVVQGQALSVAGQARLLSALPGMASDYEKRLVLQALGKRGVPSGPAAAAWLAAVDSLRSDYERRQAIEPVLAHAPATTEALGLALKASLRFGSDYEARLVLQRIAPHVVGQPGLQPDFREGMARIGSDYEQRQVLEALLAGQVDAATAILVLEQVASIGSGFEAGQVLQKLAAVMPADPGLIERYRAAARRLGDHERGRAERALDRFAVVRAD